MKKEANFIYSFLAICVAGILIEYYCLISKLPPGPVTEWISKILFRSESLFGLTLRAAFIICFLISCYLFKKFSVNSIIHKTSIMSRIMYWIILLPISYYFLIVTSLPYVKFSYPISFIMVICICVIIGRSFNIGSSLVDEFFIESDREPIKKPGGFVIPLEGDRYINIPSPNAGISVIGSAGSGKTESICFPIIEQTVIANEFTSLTYDYKFPVLANKIYHELDKLQKPGSQLWIVNFMDMTRTHRTNILHESLLEQVTFASQYSRSLVNNLMPESQKQPDFWIRSSTALLTGTIWYLRKNYPQYCTLPHVIALINNGDTFKLVEMLMTDQETDGLVSSISSAIERGADNQIAGVLSTLQTAFAVINTKNIFWALSGNDFVMDVNDPKNPKHIVIGNDTQVPEALSPIISCMMTVALKKMNKENKKKCNVIIDEAAQLYIPDFPNFPAVCRSNKISIICLAQSISQYVTMYKEDGSQTLMDNLNTQIYGRTRSVKTAKYVSELFGKREKVSESQNTSVNSSLSGGGNSQGRNESLQLKELVPQHNVLNLSTGEFYGLTMGAKYPYFHGKVKREIVDEKIDIIPPFSSGATAAEIEKNYTRIRMEAASILDGTFI